MGLEWKKLHLWRLWLSQDYPKKTLLVVKSRKGSAWSIAIRHDSFCIQSLGQKIHGMQKKQLLPVSLLVSTLQLPFASPKRCKIAITSGFGVQKICLQLGASPRFPHLCSSQYPRRSWSQFVFKSPFLWCEVHPSCSKKKMLGETPISVGLKSPSLTIQKSMCPALGSASPLPAARRRWWTASGSCDHPDGLHEGRLGRRPQNLQLGKPIEDDIKLRREDMIRI